jgi:hypothetical protein
VTIAETFADSTSWENHFTVIGDFYTGDAVEVVDEKLRLTMVEGASGRSMRALFNMPLKIVHSFEVTISAVDFGVGSYQDKIACIMIGDGRIPIARSHMFGIWSEANILSSIDVIDGGLSSETFGSVSLPLTLRMEKYGSDVRFFTVNGETITEIVHLTDFPDDSPAYISLSTYCQAGKSLWAEFDDFEIEFESIMGNVLWSIMPAWFKRYPLKIATNGDLALTPNGVTCLMQDIADALDVGGLSAFFGKPFTSSEEDRLKRQIRSILSGAGLSPRLVPNKTTVAIAETNDDGSFTSNIGVTAQDGNELLPLNLVYEYGIDGVTDLFADPPAPVATITAVGPDGYSYPAFGRDLYLDRDNPLEDDDFTKLPQWHIFEAFGVELDRAMLFLVETRDDFSISRAGEDGLNRMFAEREPILPVSSEMNDRELLRWALNQEWDAKHADGTLAGLVDICERMGFTVTIVEGWRTDFYSVMASHGIILTDLGVDRLRWAEIHLILEPADGTVDRTFQEFYQKILRRQRAGRRICFHLPSYLLAWGDMTFRRGNPFWFTCFRDV